MPAYMRALVKPVDTMRGSTSESARYTFGAHTMNKRTVPQAVFDSPEAIRSAKAGHEQACRELERAPRHLLGGGNPNHPMYDLHIFGYHVDDFMAKQYR